MLARLEDERRESSRVVLVAQEAERLRIAQELHDQVGQTLTAVLLQLSQIPCAAFLPSCSPTLMKCKMPREQAMRTSGESRSICAPRR